MLEAIYLPKLNNLTPTLESTVLKIMEESGELARAVLKFLPYENLSPESIAEHAIARALLAEVAAELLDVAQTCVTMIFVMEDRSGFQQMQADTLIALHLNKLVKKGYQFDQLRVYSITTVGNFKYLQLPRLMLEDVTLLTTVCKIQEELGELAQYLGKHAGASGESDNLDADVVLAGCAEELLDVAQCCFTMMYLLAEQYIVDIPSLLQQHAAKLRRKGYCV